MNSPARTGEPPIDVAPRDWADVVRILYEQVPTINVWAFGSRAKRTAKPYSDLDLALITQQPLSLDQLAAITDAFATWDLAIRVDLVDWASTSETFRKLIAQDGWWCRRKLTRLAFNLRTGWPI